MKKTLIALAVLAASGASFAQSSVALTGKLRFAYGQTGTAATAAVPSVKAHGIGVTDGDWNIAAVEDLGGGLKAGANMSLRLRGRDAATDATSTGVGARPRDASLSLSGGFGSVLVGAIEAGNGLLPLVTAGGPNYIGLDNGAQLAAASNVDVLQYTSPAFSGFTVRAAALDAVGGNGAQQSNSIGLIGANYANGPLSAAVDFTSYGAAWAAAADTRTRISANYDLGMARVGAGFQNAKNGANIENNQVALSVSVPVGAFNIGGIYATSKTEAVAGNNTGFDLAVQYNLSKRTYVAFQAQSTKAAGATGSATAQRVQLAHAF